MTDFKDQCTNIKVVIVTKPRIYLKWKNTEDGRDKDECYERITNSLYDIIYINEYNQSIIITSNSPYFYILEEMYQENKND